MFHHCPLIFIKLFRGVYGKVAVFSFYQDPDTRCSLNRERLQMVKSLIALIFWLGVSLSAGWVGSRFLPGEWYAALAKPSWTPPSFVFAPVWSILYVLMGLAAWLVWRRAGFFGAGAAFGLFLFQLFLNALWSYLFFGLHRPDFAFSDIVALWLVILVNTIAFWKISTPAGLLMLPYLAWVSFAGVLNLQLWRLNV